MFTIKITHFIFLWRLYFFSRRRALCYPTRSYQPHLLCVWAFYSKHTHNL